MADPIVIVDEIRAALHSEPRFGPQGRLAIAYEEGTATLEGEVESVAVKKRLLRRTAAHPAVSGIVDRMVVRPASPMGDDEIRVHLRNALLGEAALVRVGLCEEEKGHLLPVREPQDDNRSEIRIAVTEGRVTLTGEVATVGLKRMAGLLAWWVPGSRDVINGLGVIFSEAHDDDEISDAVRLALEKDAFVNASQIHVTTKDSVVALSGLVPTAEEREMAEFDAWYVFGVDDVHNAIEVAPIAPTGHLG